MPIFEIIIKSPQAANSFRILLRDIASTNPTLKTSLLEDVLFGDHTKVIPSPTLSATPTFALYQEDRIKKLFESINQQYKYFSLPNDAANFVILFCACKLIADYVECNNSNDDRVAAIHAYKLLVLFGIPTQQALDPFLRITKYFKHHPSSARTPIHDTLLKEIPLNEPVIDLVAWRNLIFTNGSKVIDLFQ